jgi:hypothetical protein
MFVIPVTLHEANDFIEAFHRHNGRTSRDGGRFAIGVSVGEGLVGVAIVGRPLARTLQDSWTAEVLRTCTSTTAPRGTNSFMYAAAWRIWRAMGGRRLVTYTLKSESGASLRGAGWRMVGECRPHQEGWSRPDRIRRWQPIYGQQKLRWEMFTVNRGVREQPGANEPVWRTCVSRVTVDNRGKKQTPPVAVGPADGVASFLAGNYEPSTTDSEQ